MAGISISTENNINNLGRFSAPPGSKKSIAISGDTSFPSTPCRLITATAGTVIFVDIACSDGVD
jgi:hypothetical protein